MIKISEHLLFFGNLKPEDYLGIKAEEYWDSLNPNVAGNYAENSLILKVRKFRDLANILDGSYVDEYADGDQFIALVQADFFNILLDNSEELLKKIIISNPKDLDLIKDKMILDFPEEIFNIVGVNGKNQTEFGKLLSENIFNYKKFRSSDACLNYLRSLSFEEVYCPYCGYEPLKLVGVAAGATGDIEKALLDLDHFFSKADFPYFAISLFNLVPCCHTCNSRYKLTKKFNLKAHIHPFNESFDDYFSFSITPTKNGNIIFVNPLKKGNKIDSVKDLGIDKRYENTKILFNIETDYNLFESYKKRGAVEDFVRYMLKDVPKSGKEILTISMGKAKRDILHSIDVHNVLKPHLKK